MKLIFRNAIFFGVLPFVVSIMLFSCKEDSDPAPPSSQQEEEKISDPVTENETPEPPIITRIDPTEGHADTIINISGKHFGNDINKVVVKVDGVSTTPISVEDELIVIAAPEHLPGEASVVVSVNDMISESFTFTYKDKTIIADSFAQDAAGWTIVGDAQGGYVVASYSEDGGVTDGYIYAKDDVLGGVWYFNAPDQYLGDKSEYYNATMKFSLFQESAMSRQFEKSDIIIDGGEKRISCQLPKFPGEEWEHYAIKINEEAGWVNGDFDSGSKATKSDIQAVLENVTSLQIRGEFETGPDTGGMDNFEIVLTGN